MQQNQLYQNSAKFWLRSKAAVNRKRRQIFFSENEIFERNDRFDESEIFGPFKRSEKPTTVAHHRRRLCRRLRRRRRRRRRRPRRRRRCRCRRHCRRRGRRRRRRRRCRRHCRRRRQLIIKG